MINLAIIVSTISLIAIAFILNIEIGLVAIFGLPFLLIFVFLRFTIAPAYIIIDGMNTFEALSASWRQMDGRISSYFLASLVIGFLGLIARAILQIPFNAILGYRGLIGEIFAPSLGYIIVGPLETLLILSVYYLTKLSQNETHNSRIFQQFTPFFQSSQIQK